MQLRGSCSKTTGRRTVAASKKVIQAGTSPDKEESETCDVCSSPIVSGKEDALLCKGSCQKWFHRYCAGVSESCFHSLSASSTPFVCWVCSQELHHTVVSQLQAEISVLRVELRKLRSDKEASQWSKIVMCSRPTHSRNAAQTSQSRPLQREPGPSPSRNDNNSTQSTARPHRPRSNSKNQQKAPSRSSIKVKIEGKRKIWGTWPTTSVGAVKNAIKSITKIEEVAV